MLNKVYPFTQRNAKTKQLDTKGALKFNSADNQRAELYFYGDIVSNTWQSYLFDEDKCPQDIVDFLSELDDYGAVDIYINSGGGSVHGGLAIYNILKRYQGEKIVHVDGIAASIASVIAFAGDQVLIPKNAQFMIHKPWSCVIGDAEDMRKEADILDICQATIMNVYMEHVRDGITEDVIVDMVNKETWLTGEQVAEYFHINVEKTSEIVACESDYFEKYRHTPALNRIPKDFEKTNKEIEQIQAELDLLSL